MSWPQKRDSSPILLQLISFGDFRFRGHDRFSLPRYVIGIGIIMHSVTTYTAVLSYKGIFLEWIAVLVVRARTEYICFHTLK